VIPHLHLPLHFSNVICLLCFKKNYGLLISKLLDLCDCNGSRLPGLLPTLLKNFPKPPKQQHLFSLTTGKKESHQEVPQWREDMLSAPWTEPASSRGQKPGRGTDPGWEWAGPAPWSASGAGRTRRSKAGRCLRVLCPADFSQCHQFTLLRMGCFGLDTGGSLL
jgi:hypothetical protein